MDPNKQSMRCPERVVDRRTAIRTIGGVAATGISLVGFSTSTLADDCDDGDDCPAIDDVTYLDCVDKCEEFEGRWRSSAWNFRYYDGQVGLSAGVRDFDDDGFVPEYDVDITGQIDTVPRDSDDPYDYLGSYGFRWTKHNINDIELRSAGSNQVLGGRTDPDGSHNPEEDREKAWQALGEILLAGGSLKYPALGVGAFLYTVAKVSNHHPSGDDEREFDVGTHTDAGSFAEYGIRVTVDDPDSRAWIEFEGWADTRGSDWSMELDRLYFTEHL